MYPSNQHSRYKGSSDRCWQHSALIQRQDHKGGEQRHLWPLGGQQVGPQQLRVLGWADGLLPLPRSVPGAVPGSSRDVQVPDHLEFRPSLVSC